MATRQHVIKKSLKQIFESIRLVQNKALFRRRTFHEPNLIRIKADPNDCDRLN